MEFVRSHFLVKEGVRVNAHGNSNPTLSIDQIDKTAKRWKHADILVFNTGHWWTHGKTARGYVYNHWYSSKFIFFTTVHIFNAILVHSTWNWFGSFSILPLP